MSKWLRRLFKAVTGLGVFIVLAVACALIFTDPPKPERLAAGDSIPGIAQWNAAEIPALQTVAARDGAPLAYRLYPGDADRAVILVHGSTSNSYTMDRLARALNAQDATVYAIDLRGHGGSGRVNGDTSYRDQLDDDLFDLVEALGLEKPGIRKSMVGFSSGGGFVLRTASGPNRDLFDFYLAISPYIAQDSGTDRPGGGWVGVSVPRLVTLAILDRLGMPWFEGLPVVRFATDAPASTRRTPAYSYRLLTGMQLGPRWRPRLAQIDRPVSIAVGSNDELFLPDRYGPVLLPLSPKLSVTILPGFGHLDMIADTKAVSMIAAMWRKMAQP